MASFPFVVPILDGMTHVQFLADDLGGCTACKSIEGMVDRVILNFGSQTMVGALA